MKLLTSLVSLAALAATPAAAQPIARATAAATATPGEALIDAFLPMPVGDRVLDALYRRMRASIATTKPADPPPPEKVEQAMTIMSATITSEFHRLYPPWRQAQAAALDKTYSPAELRQLTNVFADPRWPDLLVRGMLAIPLNYADDRSDSPGPKSFIEEIRLRLDPQDQPLFVQLAATPAGQRFLAESDQHFDTIFKDAVDAAERKARDQLEQIRDATRGTHPQKQSAGHPDPASR